MFTGLVEQTGVILRMHSNRILVRPEGEEFREGLLALVNGMESAMSRRSIAMASARMVSGAPPLVTPVR